MGTQNRERQEESRNLIGMYLPGSLYSYWIPTIFLGFPFWGPQSTPFRIGAKGIDRRCKRPTLKLGQLSRSCSCFSFVPFWEFAKIRGPNIDTKVQKALVARTPKKWTPNLEERYHIYIYMNIDISVSVYNGSSENDDDTSASASRPLPLIYRSTAPQACDPRRAQAFPLRAPSKQQILTLRPYYRHMAYFGLFGAPGYYPPCRI